MDLKNDILVSIIIPVYNVEKYLENCLKSVISQTYKNIEIILIDDGSKDSSGKICDSFASKDSRIKVYHIANGGVSNARNMGITKSNGKYIQFVDSDDTIEENMTENLLQCILHDNVDMSMCGYTKVSKDGITDISPQKGIYYFEEFLELMKYWLIDPIIGSPCNKLFIRETLIERDIKYKQGVNYAEDYLFNVSYFTYINRIGVLNSCPYKYNLMTVGSLHQINNVDLNRNWNVSIEIVEAVKTAIDRHNIQDNGFVEQLYLYFLTSNVIHRIHQDSKKECIDWVIKNANVPELSCKKNIKVSHNIFPRYTRVSLAAILVNRMAYYKKKDLYYFLMLLLYKLKK